MGMRDGRFGWGPAMLGTAALMLGAALIAMALAPATAWAAAFSPSYSWYTDDPDASEFSLRSAADYLGFVELVNGTADTDGNGEVDSSDIGRQDFKGKTVVLLNNINFIGQSVSPAGGVGAAEFDGTFDGNGKRLSNFELDAPAPSNVGVIGKAGEGSLVKGLTVDSSAKVSVVQDVGGRAISNVGAIVGLSYGSVEDCRNLAPVNVETSAVQTADMRFPVYHVGGVAGMVVGNVESCRNEGAVTVISNAGADTSLDQSEVISGIGGVIGCAGERDSSVDASSTRRHGVVSHCSNSGHIVVNTPKTAGFDRFGQLAYTLSTDTGGIAGYSRASMVDCSNTGYLQTDHGSTVGGIVGNLRTPLVAAHFSQAGNDDGREDDVIELRRCTNTGDIEGWTFPGGIVGRAGTFTVVKACANGNAEVAGGGNTVVGKRWNKPFIGGIAGGTYGDIAYCANFGTVATATSFDHATGELALGGGYFAAGISGCAFHYTNEQGEQSTPTPRIFGCYNIGSVLASGMYRQRALVGDNDDGSADIRNNVALERCVGTDELYYMGEGYTGGSEASNAEAAKTGNFFASENQIKGLELLEGGEHAIALLNSSASSEAWECYWIPSNGTANRGYPVLNHEVTWSADSLGEAEVSLAANAQYTGMAAIPSARVVLNGTELKQDVDFAVMPDSADNVEVTAEGQFPYTAVIRGIGAYTGTAEAKLEYGIDCGDLALCAVSVDGREYNARPQQLVASMVHVKNSVGVEMPADEYTVAFDQSDARLTNGEAINAGRYGVVVTASAQSAHFRGLNNKGTFTISQVPIRWVQDSAVNSALPTGIKFSDGTGDWMDTEEHSSAGDSDLVHIEYTGHPIYPEIASVVMAGPTVEGQVELAEGSDWRVVYGSSNEDDEGNGGVEVDNVGVEGSSAYGYVAVRGTGGNYSNMSNMKFVIEDTPAKNDLSKASIRGNDDVVFETGSVYRPISVWYNGSQLTEGVDYTISYSGNSEPGTASYSIEAAATSEHFAGHVEGTFNIIEGSAFQLLYAFDGDSKTAAVTGVRYFGSNELFDLEIPASVEKDGVSYAVSSIAPKAFGGNGTSDFTGSVENESKLKVRSVAVPPSVKTIGANAFSALEQRYVSSLEHVDFTDIENSQLTAIERGAFEWCVKLSEFVFPANVETIENRAFHIGTASSASSIRRLVFMTADPSLPSNIGTVMAFTGIGWSGEPVYVLATSSATAVKQFASANGSTEQGVNKGKNFVFAEMNLLDGATVASVPDQEYAGSALEPVVSVTLDGRDLVAGTDYTVSYRNNTRPGTASFLVRGAGTYVGSIDGTFSIVDALPDPGESADGPGSELAGDNGASAGQGAEGGSEGAPSEGDSDDGSGSGQGESPQTGSEESGDSVSEPSSGSSGTGGSSEGGPQAGSGDAAAGDAPASTSVVDEENGSTGGGAKADEPGGSADTVSAPEPATAQKTAPEAGDVVLAGKGASAGKYRIGQNGAVTFVKSVAKDAKLVSVPASVKIAGVSYRVTKVADKAFAGSKATTVKIGAGISVIGAASFARADKVTSITIGSGVKRIAARAFSSNKALRTLVVKTAKLTKAKARGSLKASRVRVVKVRVANKESVNKRYRDKYRGVFAKPNSGRAVSVR